MVTSGDSFGARADLSVGDRTFEIYRLDALADRRRRPAALFAEGPAREPAPQRGRRDRHRRRHRGPGRLGRRRRAQSTEIAFAPARILMQDFTGVPAVVDLAAMRDAMAALGGDPALVNPLIPAELVIDHSIIADVYGTPDAFERNAELEFERNEERYQFLRWGQTAFDTFRVVPPNTGICHQVNLEYLARVVFDQRRRAGLPRHPARHRLAHHHGQRPRRARLGGRRHRGRGGHARPAGVDAHPPGGRLQADRRSCPRAPPPPTWCSPSPSCSASTAWSASSSSSTARAWRRSRWPTGPPSATCRPSTAPPAPSSPSTTRRSLPARSPGAPRSASPWSRPTPRSRACGTTPTHEPVFSERLELDLSTVVPSLAGPSRPQDRVRLDGAKAGFRSSLPKILSGPQTTRTAAPTSGRPTRRR